jgi:hypothetical protein
MTKEKALEQPEIGDAEIKQMLNDIEYYQKRVKELEQLLQDYVLICKRCGDDIGIEYVPDEQPAQEPVALIKHENGNYSVGQE